MLNIYFPHYFEKNSATMTVYRRGLLLNQAIINSTIHTLPHEIRKTDGRLNLPGIALDGLRMAEWTYKTYERDDINYVIDPFPQSLFTYPTQFVKGGKIIFDIGDIPSMYWNTFKPRPYDKIIDFSFKSALKCADKVVVRGKRLISIIEGITGQKIEEPAIVYDPVEDEFFNGSVKRARMKQKAELKKKGIDYVLGYAGSIRAYQKGGEVIPRASELLGVYLNLPKDLQKRTALVIVGGGRGHAALLSKIKQEIPKELQKNVMAPGWVSDSELHSWMAAFDVGYMEAFNSLGYYAMIGYKVQQYFALGIPTLTPLIGEREEWKDYITGIPLLDSDYGNMNQDYYSEVAEKVEKSLGKKNRNAYAFAKEKFSMDVIRKQLGKVVEEMEKY